MFQLFLNGALFCIQAVFSFDFLVYMTAGYCVLGKQIVCVTFNLSLSLSFSFFVIVSQINRSKLYCNSIVITKENFTKSTIFCQVIGGIMIFCIHNQFRLKMILMYVPIRNSISLFYTQHYLVMVLSCLFNIL